MVACILSLSTLERRQIPILETSLAKSNLTELVFIKQEMQALWIEIVPGGTLLLLAHQQDYFNGKAGSKLSYRKQPKASIAVVKSGASTKQYEVLFKACNPATTPPGDRRRLRDGRLMMVRL